MYLFHLPLKLWDVPLISYYLIYAYFREKTAEVNRHHTTVEVCSHQQCVHKLLSQITMWYANHETGYMTIHYHLAVMGSPLYAEKGFHIVTLILILVILSCSQTLYVWFFLSKKKKKDSICLIEYASCLDQNTWWKC